MLLISSPQISLLFVDDVWGMYCYIVNYHRFSGLRQYIYYLTVSLGQISGHSLVGYSASWYSQAAVTVSVGVAFSSEGSTGRGSTPNLMWLLEDPIPCRLLDRGPQFLAGCWLGAAHSFLSCRYLHMKTFFIKVSKGGDS